MTFQQYCMSYIGLATAMGQSVDIPIYVRILTNFFEISEGTIIPMVFSGDLLAYLDVGINHVLGAYVNMIGGTKTNGRKIPRVCSAITLSKHAWHFISCRKRMHRKGPEMAQVPFCRPIDQMTPQPSTSRTTGGTVRYGATRRATIVRAAVSIEPPLLG